MLHEPAKAVGDDPAGPYKMRLRIWMFLFYGLFYAGFVAINLIRPLLMEAVVFAGLNLATVYGFALIIVALIEALIYDYMCRREEHRLAQQVRSTAEPAASAAPAIAPAVAKQPIAQPVKVATRAANTAKRTTKRTARGKGR